ncbi:hypothetical protein SEVIR_9G039222v4 [Setaria viridis]
MAGLHRAGRLAGISWTGWAGDDAACSRGRGRVARRAKGAQTRILFLPASEAKSNRPSPPLPRPASRASSPYSPLAVPVKARRGVVVGGEKQSKWPGQASEPCGVVIRPAPGRADRHTAPRAGRRRDGGGRSPCTLLPRCSRRRRGPPRRSRGEEPSARSRLAPSLARSPRPRARACSHGARDTCQIEAPGRIPTAKMGRLFLEALDAVSSS